MKQSAVTKCLNCQEVRDSLRELEQHIIGIMNEKGFENIQLEDKIEISYGDMAYWQASCKRLISFFI